MIIRETFDPKWSKTLAKRKKGFTTFVEQYYADFQAKYPNLCNEDLIYRLNKDYIDGIVQFTEGGQMIYTPSAGTQSWQAFLADPEKQWKTGYSAKALAYCWEEASGFPKEIKELFETYDGDDFVDIVPTLVLPEHKVPLPGGSTQSQNDAFVLARTPDDLISITIEGKVSEPFGETLGKWNTQSKGKITRLEYLKEQLGLPDEIDPNIRYQLLHRTASAIIEAKRFHASKAVMIVHSFSQENEWLENYQAFVRLYGKEAGIGELVHATTILGIDLYLGWAKGDTRYLSV